MIRILVIAFLCWVCLCATSTAGLVVNEVLANEPGSYTSLEWIELHNNGESSVSLGGFSLQIGTTAIPLPSDIILTAGEYFVVCRKLYATETSPGFESVWGDGSGAWGDSQLELYQTPLEMSISLKNDSGAVELEIDGHAASVLEWTEAADDGVSWERFAPDSSRIVQSADPLGCTPGFINSLTPLPNDLALTRAEVRWETGNTVVEYEVTNVGTQEIEGVVLFVITNSSLPDTLEAVSLQALAPGDDWIGESQMVLNGVYCPLIVSLSDDDRVRNNSADLVVPGSDFPPVILSEFLPNPEGDLGSEWIELKNRSDHAVDLCDWKIGDALSLHPITDDTLFIQPGEYIVLCQSELDFRSYYPAFDGVCREPAGWATLNNTGDCVRLYDALDLQADSYAYDTPYEGNYTCARGEDPDLATEWGRSVDIGGTPGSANEILTPQTASSMSVSVEPRYVSPDGDGFEDVTTIFISAPDASAYTARIFDRQGRVVKTIFDEEPMIPASVEWDGRSDAGRRLPIGIYVLYVEACGKESVKTTIVVAR